MTASEGLYTISPSNDSTIAIEVFKTGLLRKRKHILFFDQFNGSLRYSPDQPERSMIEILVDARTAVCRDKWLKSAKQRHVTQFVREQVLAAGQYPDIRFSSGRVSRKPLRGFVVEGELKIRGVSRIVKVNVVLNPMKQDRFQVDGDTEICLSDFGINRPSSFFGLTGTRDQALVRLLLWATPAS